MGLSDFAQYDENGFEQYPKFPFSLRFEPFDNLRNMFPTDLPDPNNADIYVDQLVSVPTNSKLYKVYAYAYP